MRASIVILATSLAAAAASETADTRLPPTLGVPKESAAVFEKLGVTFTCGDGTVILASAVNDDYCDCADGSDEPGTAACPSSRFVCRNSGHVEASIPSSRVNDGVCDPECCDGSDEYGGTVTCPNTCAQRAAQSVEAAAAAEVRRAAGAAQRLRLATEGTALHARRAAKLAELRSKLDRLKAENEAEKRKSAARADLAGLQRADLRVRAEIDDAQERHSRASERQSEIVRCAEIDPQPREWLDRLLRALDSLDASDPSLAGVIAVRDAVAAERASAAKEAESVAATLPPDHAERLAASQERATRIDSDISETVQRITKIMAKADKDDGPDHVFATLIGECVTKQVLEYEYKLCFLDAAYQGSIALGSFVSWGADDASKYTVMRYADGEQCWNGPKRSTLVRLECGTDNALLEVDEPEKCVYAFRVATPAACPVGPADIAAPAAPPVAHDEL